MKKIFLLLQIVTVFQCYSQTWSTGATIPEAIRAGNTASYSKNGDGYLFVTSGRNQDGIITSSHQRYQFSTNTWSSLAPHPTGILGASTAIVKDSIYVIGGLLTTPGNATRKVYKYSINENTWSLKANFPINIVDSDAVSYQDSLIYVVAGYSNKARVFNTITNQWRNATSLTPTFQSISWGSLTVKNDTLVYMCGTDGFLSSNYYNTVRIGIIDQTNRANITWTEGTPFPGQTRTFFDACTWRNGIIMTGGSTDNTFETNSNECFFYNLGTDTWTQLPNKPTSWLTGNSGSVIVNEQWKLICASGYGDGNYLYQTEIFNEGTLGVDEVLENNKCEIKNFKILKTDVLNIEFCLLNESEITCAIYDVTGKEIELKKNQFSAGIHTITLEKELSKGIYLCTIKLGEEIATKKIIISK